MDILEKMIKSFDDMKDKMPESMKIESLEIAKNIGLCLGDKPLPLCLHALLANLICVKEQMGE